MILRYLSIMMVLFPVMSQAQGSERISGKVVDAVTGEPLEYAHVVISGTAVGTIANSKGNFSLLIPDDENVDIVISFIGYEVRTLPVDELRNQSQVGLKPTTVNLPDLVISQKKNSIIEEAIDLIPENHDLGNMVLRGFWRAEIANESKTIQLSETAFDIFRYGSDRKAGEKKDTAMKILKGRISRDSTAFDSLANFQAGSTPESIFNASFLINSNFLSRRTLKKHDYQISDITTYGDRNVYVVSFNKKPDEKIGYSGTILLDVETLAFVQVNIGFSPDNQESVMLFEDSKLFAKLAGLTESTWDKNSVEINFQNYRGKWYLSHAIFEAEWTVINDKNGLSGILTYQADLVITDINKGEFELPDKSETARKEILERQVDYSEGDFWEAFNYIEPDQDFEKVFREIELRNSLREK